MASPVGIQECPRCHQRTATSSGCCIHCSAPLSQPAQEDLTQGVPEGWSAAAIAASASSGSLAAGQVLGNRYEILELLGEGGMGAVYKARDRELDRVVALKVIRPELAGQPAILQRFKQELVLARQITHRNVIRIFDLGVADGVKFITMAFVAGRDLASLLRDRRFTPLEAVTIVRQVCRALEAAHGEEVIHRDLKPQNIMIDERGKVAVMDFGLARTLESTGLTLTGAVLGTPAYMSPEQALGQPVDARSDLFALGIIFYELLTGVMPFKADTVVAMAVKRTQGPPAAPVTVDPSIPKSFSDVCMRCLAIDPAARYQTATALLSDLDSLAGDTPSALSNPLVATPVPRKLSKRTVIAVAVFAALAAATYFRFFRAPEHPVARKPITVIVADFANRTGDPLFDGALESAFGLAMEGAPFVNSYSRGQARRIAAKLQPAAKQLDEGLARLVAVREGISVIIAGAIEPKGSGYRVSVQALDATGRTVATAGADIPDKAHVLPEVGQLAAPIRASLGDTTPASAQAAAAETFSAGSLEAAHAYAAGQESMWQGKLLEAIEGYKKAVALDPNLGRAWAGLAVASSNLKRHGEAGDYYKQALSRLDRMSERERFRTLGTYYLSYVGNYGQAITTLRRLVELYPADTAGYNNLSIAYAFVRNLPEAAQASRRAVEISPHNVQTRLNYASCAMLAGNFDKAAAEAEGILKQRPGYEFAYLPLALSTLAQGDSNRARDIYARLERLSPEGFSLAKIGEADLDMYFGRCKAALEDLAPGIEADRKSANNGELAVKLLARAEAQLALGQRGAAAEAASMAVEASPVEGILFLAGQVFVQANDDARAQAARTGLDNTLESQSKSYARLLEGEVALEHNRIGDAVQAFSDGQKLVDTWISRFLLGRAYLAAGHFAEALAEFEECRRRSGEAADLFFSDTATLRYLAPLSYWIGRAQQGLAMKEAARASFQQFLKLRANADAGAPLVAETRAAL